MRLCTPAISNPCQAALERHDPPSRSVHPESSIATHHRCAYATSLPVLDSEVRAMIAARPA